MYTRTTIQVVVVRFKGVATRLSRSAEPSHNSQEDTFSNPERDILDPGKSYT